MITRNHDGFRPWAQSLVLGAGVWLACVQPALAHEHAAHAKRAPRTPVRRLELRTSPRVLVAGTPARWTLRVLRGADGTPETRFAVSHEKLMHLIVVSSDLQWFNHLHPTYRGKGEFAVSTTLPQSGTYRLFADYTQIGGKNVVLQKDISTDGEAPVITSILPVPDVVDADGWMRQRVHAIPEGQPDVPGGAEYRVSMRGEPAHLRAGEAATLLFRVENAQGQPLRDLEPYLGALGHAVVLSTDGHTYLHAHPMEVGMQMGAKPAARREMHDAPPSAGGPEVRFHTQFPRAGVYKTWGQFQHDGKIIIAAFIVNVDAPAAVKAAERHSHGTSGAAGDAKKHAAVYACPMHAEVTSTDATARCPKCGMHLVRRPD